MILVIALMLEVFVLTAMEYFTWKTLYTPLTCLMLPYTFILFLTLWAEGGNFGFVPFNYESIFIWIIGLVLFAIPSYVIGFILKYSQRKIHRYPQALKLSNFQLALSFILCFAFFWKFNATTSSSLALLGSDEFASDFAGTGLWSHLREILMCLVIMFIYYIDKRHWWLIIPIILMLAIQFIYMVKGSIIIAVIAGYLLRLYSGKSHLSLKVFFGIISSSLAIFYVIYMVLPLLGNNDGEANLQLVEFVYKHFMHYITSGTLGLSYDMDTGIQDHGDISVILSPFINLFNVATGSNNTLISAVNPCYLHTGINLTNVRTFFGTLFIYTTSGQFVLYTIALSCFLYLLKLLTLATGNLYIHFILFYYCSLLAMGWFEFYFFHLSIIEIPCLILLFAGIARLRWCPKEFWINSRRFRE